MNDKEIEKEDEVTQSTTMRTTDWIYFGIFFFFAFIAIIFYLGSFFKSDSNSFQQDFERVKLYNMKTN